MNIRIKGIPAVLTALAASVFTFNAQAQSIQDGLKLLQYEQPSKAISVFESLAKAEPTNAEKQFYLGNAYSALGKPSEALAAYTNAATLDPKGVFSQVASARALLAKGNFAEAKKGFDGVAKSTKNKDANALRLCGESYLYIADKTQLTTGLDYLQRAQAADPKNYAVYLTLGDAWRAAREGGKAMSAYENAALFDKTTPIPYYKAGSIWFNAKNEKLFMENMEKAIAIDPNFAPSLKRVADYYYNADKVKQSKDYYDKYMKLGDISLADKVQYANVLFLTKDCTGAIAQINDIIKVDTSYNYLNRLVGYCSFDSGDAANALTFMEKFLRNTKSEKIIPSDYEYYAKSLEKAGKDSLAIVNFEKAIAKDTTGKKAELYGNIAATYFKMKQYGKAAVAYETKMAKLGANAQDNYDLGRSLFFSTYSLNKADTATLYNTFHKADQAFAKVLEVKPTAASGWNYRAKCNVNFEPNIPDEATDPTGAAAGRAAYGKAKPFYEKFVELAGTGADKDKYKKDLITAYKYLGYEATTKDNYDAAKVFCQKILELDPNDKDTIETLASLEALKPTDK